MEKKKKVVFKKKAAQTETPVIKLTEEEKQIEKFNYKITEEQFWGVMRASFGIVSRAVSLFKREYGVTIHRTSVYDRAKKKPELLQECKDMMLDKAEEIGMDLLLNGDKRTKLEVYKHMTKTLGAERGYVVKTETKHSGEVEVKSVKVEHIATGVPFANSEKDIEQ